MAADILSTTVPLITSQTRSKVEQIRLMSHGAITIAPRVKMSSELDTTNLLSTSIFIHLGRLVTNAFTTGVNFRIEASAAISGDGQWYPVTIFTSALGTNVGSQAVGAALAGQNILPIGATANFVVGDIVYISNAIEANDEFGRITTVTLNTSITLEDNLLFTQTGSTVISKAEMYYALIDTSAIARLRIVVDGSGAGQNFDAEVLSVVGA